jgi:hypothetical protein
MQFNPTGSTAAQFCSTASDKEHHLMTRIRNRAALIALPLALGTLAVGASSASADSTDWGDNGSGVCNVVQSSWTPSQAGAELGTYCMQSVTGWIQINGGATQTQTISCDNNAPGGSPGLSWSLDGQAYVNAGPWNMLGYNLNKNTAGGGGATNNVGWQTGDGGDADLTGGDYTGYDDDGSDQANGGAYGYGGATVTNWGGNGNWQAAIACVNQAGISAGSSSIAPVRFRDKTMDTVNKAKGRGFLVREFALKKNVTRTSTRSCPAGMVRRGNLSYTVQEFPADHKSPKWKDRALVDVKMTPKGNNAGSVKMTLKRAKSPTVVQFQMRCGKR